MWRAKRFPPASSASKAAVERESPDSAASPIAPSAAMPDVRWVSLSAAKSRRGEPGFRAPRPGLWAMESTSSWGCNTFLIAEAGRVLSSIPVRRAN